MASNLIFFYWLWWWRSSLIRALWSYSSFCQGMFMDSGTLNSICKAAGVLMCTDCSKSLSDICPCLCWNVRNWKGLWGDYNQFNIAASVHCQLQISDVSWERSSSPIWICLKRAGGAALGGWQVGWMDMVWWAALYDDSLTSHQDCQSTEKQRECRISISEDMTEKLCNGWPSSIPAQVSKALVAMDTVSESL